jgi:hypothetical protein
LGRSKIAWIEDLEADVAEQLLAAHRVKACVVIKPAHGFDQFMVEEWHPCFERYRHACGVGVSEQSFAEEE